MDPDLVIRRALRATAFFNVGGAAMLALPGQLGWLAGMPAEVPGVYSALLGYIVLLFAATYWWLAGQSEIARPFVAFFALGKAGVFFVVTAFWLLGKVPLLSVMAFSGDLMFAAIFAWWLRHD